MDLVNNSITGESTIQLMYGILKILQTSEIDGKKFMVKTQSWEWLSKEFPTKRAVSAKDIFLFEISSSIIVTV